jgi:hypothetical protein
MIKDVRGDAGNVDVYSFMVGTREGQNGCGVQRLAEGPRLMTGQGLKDACAEAGPWPDLENRRSGRCRGKLFTIPCGISPRR